MSERPTKAEIKDAEAKRRKYAKLATKRGAKVEDVENSLRELRDTREQVRAKLKDARDPERREGLADRIEEIERTIDLLVDRIDEDDDGDLEDRLEHAEHLRDFYRERVDRLRKRRQELKAREGLLSANFHIIEFNCREGGPVPDYMESHLRELCARVLEPLRAKYGSANVNSGHRWEFYNVKIGGATGSYHEYEMRKSQPAADVTFANGSASQWAASARALGVGGVGQYATFCHTDSGPVRTWSG